MRIRPRHIIIKELEDVRRRLKIYLEREEAMLTGGVQSYTIGSRNLSRYQISLADIREMIDKLRKRERELEDELAGIPTRRAVGVTPRDW